MAIFGISIDNNPELRGFVSRMQKKLKTPDLFQNPFKGFMKLCGGSEPYLFIYLDLVWINPVYITILLVGVLFLAHGFNLHWTHIFLIPLAMGSFMFTKLFMKIAMYFSLRKFGYKGKIKFMGDSHLLLRLAKWDRRR